MSSTMSTKYLQTPERRQSSDSQISPLQKPDKALSFNFNSPGLADIPELGLDSTPSTCSDHPRTPVGIPLFPDVEIAQDTDNSPTFARLNQTCQKLESTSTLNGCAAPVGRERLPATKDLDSLRADLFKAFDDTTSKSNERGINVVTCAHNEKQARFSDNIDFEFHLRRSLRIQASKQLLSRPIAENNSSKFQESDRSRNTVRKSPRAHNVSATAKAATSAAEAYDTTTAIKIQTIFGSQIQKSQILSSILPFDTLKRLENKHVKCISDCVSRPRKGMQCRQSSKLSQEKRKSLITKVKQARSLGKLGDIIALIPEMIDNATCNSGHKRIATKAFQDLLKRICRQSVEDDFPSNRGRFLRLTSADLDVVPYWIMSFTSSSLTSNEINRNFERSLLTLQNLEFPNADTLRIFKDVLGSTGVDLPKKASSDHQSVGTTTGQTYTPFDLNGRILSISKIEADLYRLLVQRLQPSEHESGYIYMYWNPGDFGSIKIGFTTRRVEIRVREWANQCKHNIGPRLLLRSDTLMGDDEASVSGLVPFVRRVERLIHLELGQYRIPAVECKGCGSEHTEWFEVKEQLARQTVLKWSQWMRKNAPYEQPSMNLKSSIAQEEIEAVCKPIQQSAPLVTKGPNNHNKRKSIPTNRRHSAPGLRRSPRNHGSTSAKINFQPYNVSEVNSKPGHDGKTGEPVESKNVVSQHEAIHEMDSEDETDGGVRLECGIQMGVKIEREAKTKIEGGPYIVAETGVNVEVSVAIPTEATEGISIQKKAEVTAVAIAATNEKKHEISVKVEEVEGNSSEDEKAVLTENWERKDERRDESDSEWEDEHNEKRVSV